MDTSVGRHPVWASRWLVAAGIYNLAWGTLVIAWPSLVFDALGMEPARYPQIWQCVGMIVGVYGVGYLIAATSPRRHWPIVLVGMLGKVFGPMGFVVAGARGELPWSFGAMIVTNDLIWWVPFSMILWDAAHHAGGFAMSGERRELASALDQVSDQSGRTLGDIAQERPTLLVMTRHSGCTFCKEAIADVARQRGRIEEAGVSIAIVSMSTPDSLAALAKSYTLEDVHWVSDPQRVTYRALELGRGRFLQLFGPIVWWRGFLATLRGHFAGRLDGDGFQMPGEFIVHKGRLIKAYRHKTAADRVDHAAFACELPA